MPKHPAHSSTDISLVFLCRRYHIVNNVYHNSLHSLSQALGLLFCLLDDLLENLLEIPHRLLFMTRCTTWHWLAYCFGSTVKWKPHLPTKWPCFGTKWSLWLLFSGLGSPFRFTTVCKCSYCTCFPSLSAAAETVSWPLCSSMTHSRQTHCWSVEQ